MRRIHLFPGVDLEREVLEPHAVIAMRAGVGGTKAEPFVSEAQIDDLLGAPVGRIAFLLLQPERSQEVHVEGERTIDVAHRKVNVLNSAAGHPRASISHRTALAASAVVGPVRRPVSRPTPVAPRAPSTRSRGSRVSPGRGSGSSSPSGLRAPP